MLLSVFIIITLGYITYQDLKERQVYVVLFPLLGGLMGLKHILNSFSDPFLNAVGINLMVIGLMMLSIYLYSRFKLNQKLFTVFGLGDLLFFICMALGFSSLNFIIIFVFSLIFSLLIHLTLRDKNTVPLSGYMSLFLIMVYVGGELNLINNLYSF
ncbi:hypothetical protein [Psychroflexus tropicus]|uniref:hypothetical protein n=1 Tax=Psychroflexus tropicus TaxID=197345 RepID=UPI00037B8FCE|nr:hypothetical protein [Psychroflexus tropicus]